MRGLHVPAFFYWFLTNRSNINSSKCSLKNRNPGSNINASFLGGESELGKSDIFNAQLSQFENNDIMEFTKLCLDEAPDYFFIIPASLSGKYHPETDRLEHGLFYHTVSAFIILNHILENEKGNPQFNFDSRTRDLMRSAILLHDLFRCGSQQEYEKAEEKQSKFLHPIYAHKHIISHKDCGIINRFEISKIGQLVASHMGIWNTPKHEEGEMKLPVPHTPEERLVHLADYLASRNNIITVQPDHYQVTVK